MMARRVEFRKDRQIVGLLRAGSKEDFFDDALPRLRRTDDVIRFVFKGPDGERCRVASGRLQRDGILR